MEEVPGLVNEGEVLLLGELVAVQGDVAGQSGHPGDGARSEVSQQHRPGQVELDLLQPGGALRVQLCRVGEVVVVQALSLVHVWAGQ